MANQHASLGANGVALWRFHAEALYEALVDEFNGFPDDELLLNTSEVMAAYEAFREEREVESLLSATATVNVTACPYCGGRGTQRIGAAREAHHG